MVMANSYHVIDARRSMAAGVSLEPETLAVEATVPIGYYVVTEKIAGSVRAASGPEP
jgi:hypothetical protein